MNSFAKEILDAARSAHDPSEADRARVAAKLANRLGGNTPSGGGGGAVAGLGGLAKVGVPILIALAALGFVAKRGLVGSGASLQAPHAVVVAPPVMEPAAPVVPPAQAQAESPQPGPAADPASEMAHPQSNETAPPVAPPPPAPHANRSPAVAATDLAGEMALIAAAQTAIQSGDYATAIAKLDEHQRSYPSGVLSEERTAARVVALCGAGQQAEARSVATAFLARHPSSPLAPRVRASCGMQ
jgi:hypothetical protein